MNTGPQAKYKILGYLPYVTVGLKIPLCVVEINYTGKVSVIYPSHEANEASIFSRVMGPIRVK